MTDTTRHVLLLDLVNDAESIAAYRKWHEPGGPPAAINASLRDAGIVSMEIWQLHDRMALIMETAPHFDAVAKAASDAASDDVRAWEALMGKLQRPLPFAPEGVKWMAAERIYSLADQPVGEG